MVQNKNRKQILAAMINHSAVFWKTLDSRMGRLVIEALVENENLRVGICVNDLTGMVNRKTPKEKVIEQSYVSQQLKRFRDAGIVTTYKDGSKVIYRLSQKYHSFISSTKTVFDLHPLV